MWCEQVTDIADGGEEVCEGSCAALPQMGLQFCESLFDGVQVRTVGWQIQEPASMCLQCGGGFSVLVRREIVANHDSSRLDLREQNLADVGCERCSIHRALGTPRRDQLIMGQTRNEGLGAPGSEGSGGVEPGSAF